MEKSKINISPYLDEHGRIKQLPTKHSKRSAVLSYLADKFEGGQNYTEEEINTICNTWHTFHDYFILRRNLVDEGFLMRKADGSCYWRNGGVK